MKEIFIGKDVVYATGSGGVITSINDVDTLLAGSIAIFDDKNVLITAATTAANLVDSSQFWIAMGETASDGTVKVRRSRFIDRDAVVRIKTVPVTGVARVDTIGGAASALNLPSPLVAGTTGIINIRRDEFVDSDTPLRGRMENILPATRGIRVEVRVAAGDTIDTYTAKVVAAINAHADNVLAGGSGNWVTAAATGTGATRAITLTAAQAGQQWTVGLDEILIDAAKVTTTAAVYPSGTGNQVAEIEFLSNAENGDTNRYSLPAFWYKKPGEAVLSATYTNYHWKWKAELQNSIGSNSTTMQQVTYFVPSGAAALIAVIDGILDVIHSVGISSGAGATEANVGA